MGTGKSRLRSRRFIDGDGGMGTAQLRELKRLQKENERLRRAVSDLTLDKLILNEAARGNFKVPRVVGSALIDCIAN